MSTETFCDSYKRITAEIADVEKQITDQASEFERVRSDMMIGLTTHNGVSSVRVMDGLRKRLNELKQMRSDVFLEMTNVAANNVSFVKEPGARSCVGGCSPESIKFDPLHGVDVCLVCHTRYNRRVNNNVRENMSYAELKNADINIGVSGGYNPANHFSDIVGQFQGRRRSIPPRWVVQRIALMCRQHKISKRDITPQVCRYFLKQLQQTQHRITKFASESTKQKFKWLIWMNGKAIKYTDYYKHCPEIAYRLSGIPPPFLTPMQESQIFALFPLVVAGYKSTPRYIARYKDTKKRTTRSEPNNMNYLYVFYKECQLLGYTEFLPYIPLPKSLDNIDDNDGNAWRYICKLWDWSYCPTR